MTSLADLYGMVLGSSADNWLRLEQIGPTYLNSFGAVQTGGGARYLEHKEHVYRAVFIADINLGVAWGMDVNRADDDDLAIPWRKNFIGTVHRDYVDFLWCGMLVAREIVYVVDGNRLVLPSDEPVYINKGDGPLDVEEFASTASHWSTHVARLIRDLSGRGDSFDQGMAQAGIITNG